MVNTLQDSIDKHEHQQEHLAFPLKNVVMWMREGDKSLHSQFDEIHRNMYESLKLALGDEEEPSKDGGYQVESEEDASIPSSEEQTALQLPLLEPVCSSEEDEEKGYDGDNDIADTESLSVGSTDSLVLAAERLPHLIRNPQRFDGLRKRKPNGSRVPRRRGARVSCVLQRKTALKKRANLKQNQLPSKTTYEEQDHNDEAKDQVPALRLSVQRLRTQDSLPLARERIEHQHQFSNGDEDESFPTREDLEPMVRSSMRALRSQDSLLLTKERLEHQHQASSDDDDSFFHEEIIPPIRRAPAVGFKLHDIKCLHSPRAITNTQSHDVFLPPNSNAQNNQNETTLEGPLNLPSLSVV